MVLVTELMAYCIVDMHDGLYSHNQHLLDVSEFFETGWLYGCSKVRQRVIQSEPEPTWINVVRIGPLLSILTFISVAS